MINPEDLSKILDTAQTRLDHHSRPWRFGWPVGRGVDGLGCMAATVRSAGAQVNGSGPWGNPFRCTSRTPPGGRTTPLCSEHLSGALADPRTGTRQLQPGELTCKPLGDPHQAAGIGRTDQLAYYSNYGPRIDIAAPGGARKFNLPVWDRGGTAGVPYTGDDLTNVWEDFSTTSNWAVEIPCFIFSPAAGFPQGQCYSAIQGTSMATPHVSAAIALAASAHPGIRFNPSALIARVENQAVNAVNHTRALSPSDTSPGDLTGVKCAQGYCHLGGPTISNSDAYGAGLLNIAHP